MQIYLARDNQQAGPYTVEQLNQMLASQQVLLTDLIWHEGMAEWKTIGEMSQGQYQYSPIGYQAQQPTFNPQPDLNTTQSIHLNKTTAPTNQGDKELASIGKRLGAKIIDLSFWIPTPLMLTAFLSNAERLKITQLQADIMKHLDENQVALVEKLSLEMLHAIPTHSWIMFFSYLFLMLAGQAFLLHKTGQSVGKKVLNIQIVDAQTQQPVGSTRSFLFRSIVTILLIYIFPLYFIIDYLFAASKKRQTLHDFMAKTIVIEKK